VVTTGTTGGAMTTGGAVTRGTTAGVVTTGTTAGAGGAETTAGTVTMGTTGGTGGAETTSGAGTTGTMGGAGGAETTGSGGGVGVLNPSARLRSPIRAAAVGPEGRVGRGGMGMMGQGIGNAGAGGGRLNASNRRLGLAHSGGVGVKGSSPMLSRTGSMAIVGPVGTSPRSVMGSPPRCFKASAAADPGLKGGDIPAGHRGSIVDALELQML
jgi:hypothetical protein